MNEKYLEREVEGKTQILPNVARMELLAKIIGPIKELVSVPISCSAYPPVMQVFTNAEVFSEDEINRLLKERLHQESSAPPNSVGASSVKSALLKQNSTVLTKYSFLNLSEMSANPANEKMSEHDWTRVFAGEHTYPFFAGEVLLDGKEQPLYLQRIVSGEAKMFAQVEKGEEVVGALAEMSLLGEASLFSEMRFSESKITIKATGKQKKKFNFQKSFQTLIAKTKKSWRSVERSFCRIFAQIVFVGHYARNSLLQTLGSENLQQT